MNRHRRPPAALVARGFTMSLVVVRLIINGQAKSKILSLTPSFQSANPQLDHQQRREKSRFTTTTSQARNPGVQITLQTIGGDEVIYRDGAMNAM